MKIFTAAGAIHIESDPEPSRFLLCTLEGLPTDRVYLVPVIHDGDRVLDARNGHELARRIGVITNIGGD